MARYKFNKKELIIFARQLSLMVDSDVSIYLGVEMIKKKMKKPEQKEVIASISKDIKSGMSLADAILDVKDAFNPFFVNMVVFGEKSGNLTKVLLEIVDLYEKELDLKAKIISAVTYPLMVATLMMGVILLLILKIFPMFNQILIESGGTLPALTEGLLSFSTYFAENFLIIFLIIIIIVSIYAIYRRTDKGALRVDRLKFQLPIIRKINKLNTAIILSRNIALVIKSGLSISIGLEMITEIVENRHVKEKLEEAIQSVDEGEHFDEVIEDMGFFPELLSNYIAVAFINGKLDTVFDEVADYMQKDIDESLDNLTSIIEPISVIVLSSIVAVILLAVILPVINIINSIG
ncbi:type II secretion system F family protein [Acidaminobacter sp. JC074]|uniref:type II secretion system F family protein n=1 Tax=Acidaminobacter sp. JC074 TaxID=2530199 RepID=UPI001F0DEBBF|nr:type II secretion system F family protein [Acidaminobacter sp. JC074]MCH4889725.1 type II secretion system F family protein [Acidaminobacter sp. JC074]